MLTISAACRCLPRLKMLLAIMPAIALAACGAQADPEAAKQVVEARQAAERAEAAQQAAEHALSKLRSTSNQASVTFEEPVPSIDGEDAPELVNEDDVVNDVPEAAGNADGPPPPPPPPPSAGV